MTFMTYLRFVGLMTLVGVSIGIVLVLLHLLPRGWRENVLFVTPSVAVFLFAILSGWTLVSGIAAAIAVPMLGVLGFGLCLFAASYVMSGGEATETEGAFRNSVRGLTSVHMAAGVLMVSLVWMWWQTDRAQTMDDVVACMESSYEPGLSPAQLAQLCYESLGDDLSDADFYGYD